MNTSFSCEEFPWLIQLESIWYGASSEPGVWLTVCFHFIFTLPENRTESKVPFITKWTTWNIWTRSLSPSCLTLALLGAKVFIGSQLMNAWVCVFKWCSCSSCLLKSPNGWSIVTIQGHLFQSAAGWRRFLYMDLQTRLWCQHSGLQPPLCGCWAAWETTRVSTALTHIILFAYHD